MKTLSFLSACNCVGDFVDKLGGGLVGGALDAFSAATACKKYFIVH